MSVFDKEFRPRPKPKKKKRIKREPKPYNGHSENIILCGKKLTDISGKTI